MYPRKRTLKLITELLNGKLVVDDEGIGSGKSIKAENKIVDISLHNLQEHHILSIMPAPHNVELGLLGYHMDSNYKLALQGFVAKAVNEELIEAGEDVIDFIMHTLTTLDNIELMRQARFSIIQMGPVLNEQYDDEANIAYISVPLSIQFVEQ